MFSLFPFFLWPGTSSISSCVFGQFVDSNEDQVGQLRFTDEAVLITREVLTTQIPELTSRETYLSGLG